MAAISLFGDFNKRTAHQNGVLKTKVIQQNAILKRKRIKCKDAMGYKNKRKANCFDVYYMQ